MIERRAVLACTFTAAIVGVLTITTPARAYIGIAMQPIPETIVIADAVVFGKVSAQEKGTIRAKIYADNAAKWDFVIFELTATSVIKGKEAKTFRVGVPQMDYHKKPIKTDIDGKPRLLNPEVKVGVEGAFLLIKHSELDFYVLPTLGGFLDKNEDGYDKEAALLRRCARLLDKPDEALRSKDKEDRFLTAYMLVYDYCAKPGRTAASKGVVAEAVDQKQTRLILQALLDADWTPPEKIKTTGPLSPVRPYQLLPWMKLDEASMKKKPALNPFKVDELTKGGRQWLQEVQETAQLQRLVRKPPATK
jgi:hypothetical protein